MVFTNNCAILSLSAFLKLYSLSKESIQLQFNTENEVKCEYTNNAATDLVELFK